MKQIFGLKFMLLVVTVLAHDHASLQIERLKKFVGLVQPEQIHIAFGNTAQDMVIMWATKRDVKFFVEFAERVDNMKKLEAEKAVLEESSSRAAKYLHRVYLEKLKPGEKYVYRIVGESGATSSIYTFNVPKVAPKKVHTFIVLADMGLSSNSLQFLTYEAAGGMYDYEAVFHIGDIAHSLHMDEGSYGDLYLKHLEKFAAKAPYMTVPGDLERFHDYMHYRYRFSMPNTPWPMPIDKLWYSIDIGPVHFITINTEVFYTLTDQQEKQLSWLRDELQIINAERENHPWIIVLGHVPMYCSPSDADGQEEVDCANESTSTVRSKLEDLFFEEGVDLYISGHRHSYERSWPLYRGKVFQHSYKNPKAPVHIINGAMGYVYLAETITKSHSWSAFSFSDPKKELYGKLQVLNSSHLMWDVFVAKNNEHVDSIVIIQLRHGSFGKAGDEVYETLVKLQQLPRAPFHWQPPTETQDGIFKSLYSLPPPTRKFYLLTLCCTLFTIVLCVLSVPKVRKRVCRK